MWFSSFYSNNFFFFLIVNSRMQYSKVTSCTKIVATSLQISFIIKMIFLFLAPRNVQFLEWSTVKFLPGVKSPHVYSCLLFALNKIYYLYCLLHPRSLNSGVKLKVPSCCFSTKKKFTLLSRGEIHTDVYWQKYFKIKKLW